MRNLILRTKDTPIVSFGTDAYCNFCGEDGKKTLQGDVLIGAHATEESDICEDCAKAIVQFFEDDVEIPEQAETVPF